jgi:hypothetical protein
MDIYLVPRVFWQGGATYGNKVQLISYLDRNYTGIETWTYFTHEGTHALAQDILQPKENGGGPDGVLVEGLAVWASGGHYRLEPIDDWAAVIAGSDSYLPLPELRAGPFYEFQHETSYIEAASFTGYLIDRYGLDKHKELYGRATGNAVEDQSLLRDLFGKSYDELDADWLAYLGSLQPTREEAETWRLKVRSFDLMRRYETELDPDARILPNTTPPEWMTDTHEAFVHRLNAPLNVVLETALIAAQERLYSGNPEGAEALLDDVEAALDAEPRTGSELAQPSLHARWDILEMLAVQDRAVLHADIAAYRDTLDPTSPLAQDRSVRERLKRPYVTYEQEVVRLDLADDGLDAVGVVLVHSLGIDGGLPDDGQLFAVHFVHREGRWLQTLRGPVSVNLSLPPLPGG